MPVPVSACVSRSPSVSVSVSVSPFVPENKKLITKKKSKSVTCDKLRVQDIMNLKKKKKPKKNFFFVKQTLQTVPLMNQKIRAKY
jgi:phage pi2 protein 07